MFEITELMADFINAPAPEAKELWEQVYDEMTVHTQGRKPKKIIESRRPYEDEGIKEYRLESYEPITKDAINRAIQNLQRLFSNANYRLEVDPSEVRPYISENNFNDKDFMQFIASDVTRRMIEDPNGCLVYWPSGDGLTNPTVRIDVTPMLVLSKSIHFANNDALVWLSQEKSMVKVGDKLEQKGEVYYVASRSGYYKAVQVGKKSDKKFQLEVHYLQEVGYAPYVVLGGEPNQKHTKEGEIDYFESYFSTYLPWANEAIRQFSDHQGIMVTSAFPIREMEPIECTAEGCSNGKIYDKEKDERRTCGTCHGKGYIVPPSPYGVLLRPPKASHEDASNVAALRYISPDTGIIELAGKHWRDLLKDAEKALNLLFIDEAQSGVAKKIDREDKEAAIDRIGANVYNNIVRNSLIIITDLLTIGTGMEPHVHLPPTFRIKSEAEVIEELTTLKKEGAPDFLISEATRELMHRRYSNDPSMIRMVDLLAEFDTFFALSTKEKRDLFASGGMEETEYLFSVHSPKYLRSLMEREDFLELTTERVKALLDEALRAVINRRPIDGTLDA